MAHHTHHTHTVDRINLFFAIAASANLAFVIIEVIYALYANSMSLLADAVHNFGDVFGIVLAGVANWLLSKPSNQRYSYGFKKTTVLAALINALVLVGTSAIIGYESINKLLEPTSVDEKIVIIVALIGVVVNSGTALLFLKGQKQDLNVKGTFMHLAADALIALGVALGGFMILWGGWEWLDPVISLIIVLIVLFATWGLLRDSTNMIMDAVPQHIDQRAILDYLRSLEGITEVHDLHIWSLSTQHIALTAHLVKKDCTFSDAEYKAINETLQAEFNIHHATLQIEQGDQNHPCAQLGQCSAPEPGR